MTTIAQRRARRPKRPARPTSPSSPKAMKPQPSNEAARRRHDINGPVIAWLVLIHLGALAAPFFFSWQAVVLTVALHWLTGSIGICLGYHRLLTHGSFQTYGPVRWLLATIGSLAGEGPPLNWVADHRQHHAHSDQEGDPHSPRHGAWWSHMLWLGRALQGKQRTEHIRHWAPDLFKDPGMRMLDKLFLPLHIGAGLALAAWGWSLGGWFMAASFVSWGVFARLVFVLHATWLVNSASHMWGYRNYHTSDDSRNNWFVALITYGEGWHNNHHAYPRMANHGHRWWEIDLTFAAVRLLRRCGLAWSVVDYKHKSEQRQSAA